MSQFDPYGDWDAAYVLGALTVQQRHEYEDHLAGCPDCRSAVGELAAMPGLLAQLPAAEAVALSDRGAAPDSEPVPDSIRDLTPPRRFGLRARLLLVAAVVLALVVGALGGFLVRGAVEPSRPNHGPSVLVAFNGRQPSGLIATAKLTPAGSRTKISMNCVYALHAPGEHDSVDLALQAVDDQGQKKRLWSWWAAPGDYTAWPGGWQPLPFDKIAALQIVNLESGSVVMSAPIN